MSDVSHSMGHEPTPTLPVVLLASFLLTSVLPVVGHLEQPGSPLVPLNTVLGVGAVVIVIIIVLFVVIGLVILRRMRARQTITVSLELGKISSWLPQNTSIKKQVWGVVLH